ncbi:hypothetical protein BX600DRAFT_157812 [Xylariales sp. PMI_506]|nr:hypothetical protein BX600DRAFT_157812 [Xylariales sp. PMI_506]
MNGEMPVASANPHPESDARRRKLRKGTRSCWECKRRKIRCVYSSNTDKVCVHCRRRGATCVSQDLPESPRATRTSRVQIDERMVRVEDLLQNLTSKLNQDAAKAEVPEIPASDTASTVGGVDYLTPVSTECELGPHSVAGNRKKGGIEAISAALRAALPSRDDLQMLYDHGREVVICTHFMCSERYSSFIKDEFEHRLAALPLSFDPNIHPVKLARVMFTFALLLQSPWHHRHCTFTEPAPVIRERMVTAAISLVTTNDRMHGSLESLECIMLEARYHTNTGNMRLAWLVNRRAMSVAQLMGVDRPSNRSLKSIDPNTTFHPDFMWFRIVYMDRYLCLLLGLPQGTTVKVPSPVEPTLLVPQLPLCQLEGSLINIASRILERNQSGQLNLAQDQAIDAELLEVSQNLPEDFWRAPNFDGMMLGSFEDSLENLRIIAQVFHFNILNQLHLPYMLSFIHSDNDRSGSRHEWHSAITCANASREILSRFIVYRNFNYMALCFRLVDFTALTAALTLLLAHLDTTLCRRRRQPGTVCANNLLAHQRLSDRALLEQVLDKLALVCRYNNDEISIKCAQLIGSLLEVEAEAARGKQYNLITTRASEEDGGAMAEHSEPERDEDDVLRIPIASFGIIRISRAGSISKVPGDENAALQGNAHGHMAGDYGSLSTAMPAVNGSAEATSQLVTDNLSTQPSVMASGLGERMNTPGALFFSNPNPSIAAGIDDWAFQGVDMAFFESLTMGGLGALPSEYAEPHR